MNRVSKEQIQEWTENPVTLALRDEAQKELGRIMDVPPSDNLVRGEPSLSQENLIESTTREIEWTAFVDLLEGDWSELEIEDDSYEVEDEVDE